jgi:hypothetical protein
MVGNRQLECVVCGFVNHDAEAASGGFHEIASRRDTAAD